MDSENLTPKEVAKIPFFKDLDQRYINQLADKFNVFNCPKGFKIVSEGDNSKRMFFILEGTVRVFKRKYNGIDETLCELKAPNYFGEMSIVDGGPRSADVEAGTKVILAELIWDDVKDLFDDKPEVMNYILKNIGHTLSMRLRKANSQCMYNS